LYEILAPLGAGGMGEVYRARDTQLGRDVAVKVLSGKLATDPDSLDRFAQEARSAAALNHPNIVTIYSVGEENGAPYIAMELVEGRSLREVLREGVPPLRSTVVIAAQITDALAALHERGIVHRDLKPENIIVSGAGLVKLLDFGLAKLAVLGPAGASTRVTMPGALIGTAAYMSPEQAEGKPSDYRSDQFAVGALLYEMITGSRPFDRATVVETLAAILREDPVPISRFRRDVVAPLVWAVERCLEKKPERRYASSRDLARDMAALRDGLSESAAQLSAPARLPVSRSRLIGRERELSAVKEILLRAEVRVATLTGPGGTGKTRLALEVASALAGRFAGRVWFVSFGSIFDPNLVATTIASELGIRAGGSRSIETHLVEALQDAAESLIVLDNFEQVVEAAPLVAELIKHSAKLKVLVTSRAPLRLYGEREIPVPPLSTAALPSQPARAQSPAVALFIERAEAVRPDLVWSDENLKAAAEICARVDGLPLAIELAAARTKVLPPAAMLGRLARPLDVLTSGARDLPSRQQTLRSTIAWSYDLLSVPEQRLFSRLAVFVGGCTLEGAEAVCNPREDLGGDPLELISSLIDKSLLASAEGTDGELRFTMLQTIREYALERLAQSGEEAGVRRAHAAYFLVLAEESDAPGMSDAEHALWFDRFEAELDNFRAALDWLGRAGSAEWGLRLGTALLRFWDGRGHVREGRARMGALLELPGAARRTKTRARALFAAGILAGYGGQENHFFKECLEIFRELDDRWGALSCVSALAVARQVVEDYDAARGLHEEAVELARRIGDPTAIAGALNNLAVMSQEQGDYTLARSLFEETATLFLAAGDRRGVASTRNHLGDLACEQGDYATARELYDQSLAASRELGDRWGVAGTLADLGALACEQGAYGEATERLRESVAVFQDLKHDRGISRVLEAFAELAAARGEAARALRLAGAAAGLRQRLGLPDYHAPQRRRLGHCLEQARAALDGKQAAAEWLEGSVMTAEVAVREAVAPD